MPSRAVLYVYSNKNIAGCVLGLGALVAFFTGLIHDYWFEIVAGAYGIGALAVPGQPQIDVDLEGTMTPAQIADQLATLARRVEKLVPPDVLARVQSIVQSIDAILPMLEKSHSVADQDAFTIRQTALHYLPDTLAAYLKLPPAYRNMQPLENGKTAKALLLEQLTILDAKMRDVARNLTTNDAQALLANGEFLREKFSQQSFLTPV